MERERDLRAERTDRAIRGAFLELILKKPVDRITVKELAERAEINKGTFYLHYRDIYDLYRRMVAEAAGRVADRFDPYPDLLRAPEEFVRTFLFAQVEHLGEDLTGGERALLAARNIRYAPEYPRCFLDAFRTRIYRVGELEPCEENDLRLDFLLTGMLSILIQHRPSGGWEAERRERVVSLLAPVIRELFPELCRPETPRSPAETPE